MEHTDQDFSTSDGGNALPVAFWGDPDQPLTEEQQHAQGTIEWTPSFTAIGYNIHDALQKCLNTYSALIGKDMRTIEDVYRHVKAIHEGIEANILKTEPTTVAEDKQATQIRKDAIKAAAAEWHAAVEQRRVALLQWDEYVRAKKKVYQDLKAVKP